LPAWISLTLVRAIADPAGVDVAVEELPKITVRRTSYIRENVGVVRRRFSAIIPYVILGLVIGSRVGPVSRL
jgi:hypothetical protein